MMGYLERTIEFTRGPIGNFEAVAGQIDPPLHPIGMAAIMAIHGAKEGYDPAVEDFAHDGPRGDADTPAGAGSLTLDLLRHISTARQHPLFNEYHDPDPHTGDVMTTIFHKPEERSEAAAEYTEILRVARHLQPVTAIAIQYTQERDSHSGALLGPTTIHLNAMLGNDPGANMKNTFTNVSIDDGWDVVRTLTNPGKDYLTVTAGYIRSLSVRHPDRDYPPSFHHVRIWTQLLHNIVAR